MFAHSQFETTPFCAFSVPVFALEPDQGVDVVPASAARVFIRGAPVEVATPTRQVRFPHGLDLTGHAFAENLTY